MPGKPKGLPKSGGRKAGEPNKITTDARKLFLTVMEGQMSNVEESLLFVREKDHSKYIELLSKLMPYFMPKQIDIKSDGEKLNGPVKIENKIYPGSAPPLSDTHV